MTEKYVDAHGLTKAYHLPGGERVEVLRGATCVIKSGDRIALEGSSGSGKSTLLSLLGGLVTPTSGDVSWPALGDRGELQPLQIAFVFQSPSLFPALNVLQNVTLPLILAGRTMHSMERAERLLDLFGLTSLANRLPEELSGGQAQRVAIARALVVRPKLLLADEPTGQLDGKTAMSVIDILLGQLEHGSSALLIATHDHKVAHRMSRRWTMERGLLSTDQEALA